MLNEIPDVDLKALRKKLELTQKEFSEKYLIPYETLKKWEQGDFLTQTTSRLLLYLISELPEKVDNALKKLK